MTRPSRARSLLRVMAMVAVVALLLWFALHVDWRSAWAVARRADPVLLLAALLCNLLSQALKGVRWWVFLRSIGVRSLGLVLRATFAGASLNNLVVAQGGEGARVLLVARGAGVSSAGVLAALTIERMLDAVSYLALLVGAAWMLELPEPVARWRTAASVTLAVATVVLLLTAMQRRRPGVSPASSPPAPGRVSAIGRYLRRFARGMMDVATPTRLAVAMLLSVAAWALQLATYHLTARAAQLELPLAGSVVALLMVGVSFLVRATPGNVGVFQVIYALSVRPFGVLEGPAVAAALLIQVLQVIPTMMVAMLAAPGLASGPVSRLR